MFTVATRGVVSFLAIVASVGSASAFPNLVPSRRADVLSKRDPCIDDLMPKETAALHYAIAPHEPATAIVTLAAHPGLPLLLLEDVDHLLDSISCSQGSRDDEHVIHARFASDVAYTLAHESWSSFESFIVLSEHPGCNTHNERGAWRASGIHANASCTTISLAVEEISMRQVARSFGIRYDHDGGATWESTDRITKRDEHDINDIYTVGYNTDIPTRYPLFPPNSTIDASIASALLQQLTEAEIDLTCINCGMKSNLSLGVDFQINVADSSCLTSSESCFDISAASVNLTVQALDLSAALEVFLGKEITAGANYKVLWIPVGPGLKVPGIVEIGPGVGIEIAFDLDIWSTINFTYGATGHVPTGAFASVNLINSTGGFEPTVIATGWDHSDVDQVPFRVNGGEFNVTTSVSFAPYAEVAFTVFDTGAAVRLTANMPQVATTASLRTNVNRECNTVGADDFEFFDTAFVVGAGLELSTTASFILEEGVFDSQGFPDHWDLSIWSDEIPLAPAHGINSSTCFVLSDDLLSLNNASNSNATPSDSLSTPAGSSTLPGVPATTGTLFAAASAVPTWDFQKIESYYSASSQLPTNVDYSQMVQATTVPDNIKSAVNSAAQAQKKSSTVPTAKADVAALLFAAFTLAFTSL